MIIQHLLNHVSLFKSVSLLFKGPKQTHIKPTTRNALILWSLGLNAIRLNGRSSWSPMNGQPSTSIGHRQPIRGPQRPEITAGVMGSMSATSGAHMISSCHHKKGKQWLSTPLLVPEKCSLPRAFPCRFQHNQLTMALHLTGNYGSRYYSCSRPMDKSLKTVGHIQDTWGMGKLHDPCPSQSLKGLRE